MKYNEEKVQLVRDGKAQIKANQDYNHNGLLNHIFKRRNNGYVSCDYYYSNINHPHEYNCSNRHKPDLPIIEADDFYITTPEPNWVEVRNSEDNKWEKRILLHDLGDMVICNRYACVTLTYEEKYLSGEKYGVSCWNFMRPIPAPKELTHAEIEAIIGEPFKYIP